MTIRTIRITGPESSGKTSLAKALAAHFECPWVPEYAREYLNRLGRPYKQVDLDQILTGQLAAEAAYRKLYPDAPYLFCDTGPEVIYIWSEVKYGFCSPAITATIQRPYAMTLLCAPDLQWQPDPLREAPNANDRKALFERYQGFFEQFDIPFQVVNGQGEMRFQNAMEMIDQYAALIP